MQAGPETVCECGHRCRGCENHDLVPCSREGIAPAGESESEEPVAGHQPRDLMDIGNDGANREFVEFR